MTHYDPIEILNCIKAEIEDNITKTAKTKDEIFFYMKNKCDYPRKHNIAICYGSTRGVIVPDEDNFVIKFDLDEESDFCEVESENYAAAKEEDLESFFAATSFLTKITICGLEFCCYIQQKVDAIYGEELRDYVSALTSEDFDNEDEYMAAIIAQEEEEEAKNEDSLPIGWAERLIDDYGRVIYDKLVYFLKKHFINDLHSENVGFINERCIIFDYAGF